MPKKQADKKKAKAGKKAPAKTALPIRWHHEERPIKELQGYDRNPRIIKKRSRKFQDLDKSIGKFGLAEPVTIQPNGTIIGGHARVQDFQKRKQKKIDCWVPERPLNAAELKELNIRLNKNIAGEWDLDELKKFDLNDLMDWGFLPEDLGLEKEKPGKTDEDAVPPVPGKAKSKKGQIFQLGEHRLMCGDATNIDDVEALMAKEAADLVWTDPPYNVNYESKKTGKIANDNMTDNEFYSFLHDALNCLLQVTRAGGAIYICHADSNGLTFRKAMIDAGWMMKQAIIWVKDVAVLGRQDYNWQHEPILYGWKEGAAHYFAADFTQKTVKEEEGKNLQAMPKDQLIKEYQDLVRRIKTTVTKHSRPRESDLHPTMKPVKLIKEFIRNSTRKGGIILDTFGGSGSTMIAAEETYRKARVLELEPRYCDVIIRRWEEFTGEKAKKL